MLHNWILNMTRLDKIDQSGIDEFQIISRHVQYWWWGHVEFP
jgi:hypothetical protein